VWSVRRAPEIDTAEQLEALAVARDGDVLAGGEVVAPQRAADMVVVCLNGATGDERWRRTLGGSADLRDRLSQLALDGRGDVWVAGKLGNVGTCYDFTVVHLAGSDGDILSLDGLDGTATASRCDVRLCLGLDHCPHSKPRQGVDQDEALSLRIDPAGVPFVQGTLTNNRWETGL
jgi:outer membrane protein assembly factor BamB